jgi:amino acid adenylation domain-containing protein
MIAVLRCGAAGKSGSSGTYAARLRYISSDADLDVVLSDRDLPEGVTARATVRLDREADEIAGRAAQSPASETDSAATAYVMYTSGSTGYPKGTVVRHRNVVNFFLGMDEGIGIGPGDTVLALTSISFDISVLELLWPLTRGATVAVAGERMIERLAPDGEPGSFADLCELHRPTHLQATPSFLSVVAAHPDALRALSGLRVLLSGGEALPSGLAAALMTGLPDAALFNMYGPTETTIWSTVHRLDPRGDAPAVMPIGRPVANTVVRVVRSDGADAAIGVAGELWIGGDGVTAGYLGKPELTADKFVHDQAGRWYRTGDRARWGAGALEFLGRIDRQVKVAGHRIELDEIESVLSRHPRVGSVAVVARERHAETELHAYISPAGEATGEQALYAHIGQWREVWDGAYADSAPGPDAEFAGWRSSYTGDPIPAEEMREWLRHSVDRALALGGARVVDVGVGAGLFLREFAPRVTSYRGLDLSSAALAAAGQVIAGRFAGKCVLEQGDAMALAALPDDSADLVLLNSVVQYFPSADYLRRVLEHALRVVGPGGAVFVGDVRDLDLLDAFHAHVQVHRAPPLASASEVAASARRAAADERELCLAPDFFTELAASEAAIGVARAELKRGSYANELTRFRYDVTLLGKDRMPPEPEGRTRVPWSRAASLDGVSALIAAARAGHEVVITGVPNRRLTEPLAAAGLLAGDLAPQTTAWDMQRALWEHDDADAIDLADFFALGDRCGRRLRAHPQAGSFDAVFEPVTQGPAREGIS